MAKKVILIAGGSHGIGKFLVDSLTNNFIVSVCSRGIENKETNNFLSWKCDLSKKKEVENFLDITIRKFGYVHIMIYNAGLMLFDDFLDIKEKDINMMYDVIVKGYLFLCQRVIPIMRKQKYGQIINISSTRGITAMPNKGAYSAMKRAAVSLTDSIRMENRGYGIRITSAHFGLVNTESSREIYGKDLYKFKYIEQNDILKTIKFLISLSQNAHVDSVVVGGQIIKD